MSNIFNEVDEELRRERLKQLWDRYSIVIVGVALLIIIGIGGWRGYEWWQAKRAAEAGAVFEQAVTLVAEGKYQQAEEAFARIAADDTAYRTLAKFRHAGEVARRDRDAALKIFDSLVAEAAVAAPLQDLARIRAGMLLVDTAPLDEMRARLEPATPEGRVFRHSARELMAFAAWRAGNAAATKQWFDAIMADQQTPQGVRTRVEMLMALATPQAGS